MDIPALFTRPSMPAELGDREVEGRRQSCSLVTSCRRNRAAGPSFAAVSAPCGLQDVGEHHPSAAVHDGLGAAPRPGPVLLR